MAETEAYQHQAATALDISAARGTSSDPALKISHLVKEFKPSRSFREKHPERLTAQGMHRAVADISLQVYPGEVVVLLGANGAGKTTILACAQGLTEPTSGTIQLLSEDPLLASPEMRASVGIMLQDGGLPNAVRPVPLLEHVAQMYANPYPVGELVDRLGIDAFNGTNIRRLSGGQKQRVAIAGIVAMRPSILILDEATSMLDPEGRQELIQSIKAIRKEYGMTVLSITHDLDEVALSDRVLVLKKGKVESVSSPRELFSRGSELVDLGLDIPFSALLTQKLRNKGLIDCEDYLTEKELVEQLWESLSKM